MNLLWPFISAFFACLVLTPITIILARKFGFVDDPKKHKHPAVLHKKTVPRAGGLAIFIACLSVSMVFLPLTQRLLGIFLGGLVLVIIGLVDDKCDLGKIVKLTSQLIAALLVVAGGVGITFIVNPFSIINSGGPSIVMLDQFKIFFNFFGQHSIVVLADIFAVLWIVWVTNMVNFSTGVDGQMPGIVLIALIVLFIASLKFTDSNQLVVTKLALIGAGATAGFLIYNFSPAKIFPGDSGSYFLGYLVAVLAILSGAKVGTAILVMAVPLTDGVFTIIRRVASGRSPFSGDRGHLHHKLLELGLNPAQIALFYWTICAILGTVALSLNSTGKIFALIVIATVVIGGLLWLNMTLPLKAQK